VRIISSDGIGVAAMVRAAEKLYEVIDEFGVDLGVIDDPVYGKAIAVVPRGGSRRVLVTVERNPKIVERPEVDDGR
jgi:pyruvate-formate lyase-activating enzyme